MIRGLDIFRERFRTYEGSLVLIGGAACDDGFSRQELTFRATKDLDIVLLLEAVDHKFVATMRQFIHDGGYQIRQRSESDSPVLYRLAKPTNKNFPHMLEIFSQAPEGIDLVLRLVLHSLCEEGSSTSGVGSKISSPSPILPILSSWKKAPFTLAHHVAQ
jgi:hypothetical protein